MSKKAIAAILVCVILVFSIGGFTGARIIRGRALRIVSAEKSAIIKDGETVHYVAHRGFSGAAPENTLPAIEKAGQAGYKYCEFDVYPTKDSVWILMHDEKISRTTTGSGYIEDYTYEELLKFDIKYGSNIKDYPSLKIPTLDEALDVCEKYGMRPVIEIKGGKAEDLKVLCELIEKKNLKAEPVLISFNFSLLLELRKLTPDTEMWLLVSEIKEDTLSKCREINAGLSFDGKNEKNYPKIKPFVDEGILVAAWTIDDIKLHDTLYSLGVRYITTNRITPPN
ncbi:MAG: hypothetical protein GXY95_07980 [Clostridiales bacterium]|jgi:glycerophosphoryl diester phosphodiesterase|nr:hypothetical protein [Clostridiales bacterium]HOL79312.1 glycerophosphodiester phosphodiesterase family protein [Clostridiales bacterium]HPP67865.1 glycerophosphodiester phosphodiesterase family protein [Clostridiales bacterium]HPU66630.1 glycerophosphodiester phosphodiesterase family protein [Clostridiales bacterium]HQA05864.1 glycerophosphodiester phosphodiesterase family protein [Clostridiales bacterium]